MLQFPVSLLYHLVDPWCSCRRKLYREWILSPLLLLPTHNWDVKLLTVQRTLVVLECKEVPFKSGVQVGRPWSHGHRSLGLTDKKENLKQSCLLPFLQRTGFSVFSHAGLTPPPCVCSPDATWMPTHSPKSRGHRSSRAPVRVKKARESCSSNVLNLMASSPCQ